MPVTYVGHPLADVIPLEPKKDEARAAAAPAAGQADRGAAARQPALRAALHGERLRARRAPLPPGGARRALRLPDGDARRRATCSSARVHRDQRTDLPLTLLFGHSHEALAAADLALVASGTATLETALFKTPMVIAYRQSPLTSAPDARNGLPALRRHAEHPRRRAAGAGAPAGRGHPGGARRGAARAAARHARRATARSSASASSTICCARTPPRRRPTPCSGVLDENAWHSALVCGVDEAGRGPLAGPVYAAAVILDPAKRASTGWRTPRC